MTVSQASTSAPTGAARRRPARPRRQADIAEFRRKALIEAALAQITVHGIAGSTLQRIAAAAGVTHGLIRHYFRGKGDLLVQAFKTLINEFHQALAADPGFADSDPAVRLRALVEVNFRPPVFQRERLAAWAAFWDAARTDGSIRAANRAFYAAYRRDVAALLTAAGVAEDSRLNVEAAADGLIAVMDGVWLETTVDPDSFEVDRARRTCLQYLERMLPDTVQKRDDAVARS
ncbi:MAG: transcriptional regulator BetI [Alphaproteobacteria bacterium]